MKIDNIIFDFNGTIIDDVDLCHQLLNQLLKSCNHPTVSKKQYRDIFKFPIIEYYEAAGFNFKNKEDDFTKLGNVFQNEYHARCNDCGLYDGILDTFKKYCSTKRLIILSATETGELIMQLEHYGIINYFKNVLGIDNIYGTSKVGVARDFFKKNKIDPNRTVVIGDTDHDYEVAKELNCHSILTCQGHQARWRLEACNPDFVIDNIKDIWKIIE